MTATEIIRDALEIYARSTLGHDRYLAEQLAVQAEEMAEVIGRGDPLPATMFPHIVPCDSF